MHLLPALISSQVSCLHLFVQLHTCKMSHGESVNCEAFTNDEQASVTCFFHENIDENKVDFVVEFHYPTLTPYPDILLDCHWLDSGDLKCRRGQGVSYRRTYRDQVVVTCPSKLDRWSGLFRCQVVPPVGITSHTCKVKPVDEVDNTTPKDQVDNTTPKDTVENTTPKDQVDNTTPKDTIENTTPKVRGDSHAEGKDSGEAGTSTGLLVAIGFLVFVLCVCLLLLLFTNRKRIIEWIRPKNDEGPDGVAQPLNQSSPTQEEERLQLQQLQTVNLNLHRELKQLKDELDEEKRKGQMEVETEINKLWQAKVKAEEKSEPNPFTCQLETDELEKQTSSGLDFPDVHPSIKPRLSRTSSGSDSGSLSQDSHSTERSDRPSDSGYVLVDPKTENSHLLHEVKQMKHKLAKEKRKRQLDVEKQMDKLWQLKKTRAKETSKADTTSHRLESDEFETQVDGEKLAMKTEIGKLQRKVQQLENELSMRQKHAMLAEVGKGTETSLTAEVHAEASALHYSVVNEQREQNQRDDLDETDVREMHRIVQKELTHAAGDTNPRSLSVEQESANEDEHFELGELHCKIPGFKAKQTG